MAKNDYSDLGFEEKSVNNEHDDIRFKPSESHSSEGGFTNETVGDIIKSLGQGATLGGGDEILGAIQGSYDYLKDPKVKSWLDAYRNRQKAAESEYDKVRERSPILSTVGEIVGGFALPVGAVLGAAKGVGTVGKLAMGSGLGAAIGGLSSHGTLENSPMEIGKDALVGGGMGAGAELGGMALAKSAKGIGNAVAPYIEDSPKIRQILKAFTEGQEGKGFTGDKNKTRIQNQLDDNASNLARDLDKGKIYGKEQYSKVMGNGPDGLPLPNAPTAALENSSANLSTLDRAEKAINEIGSGPFADDMLQTINSLKSGAEVPAQKIKELQMFIRDNKFNKDGFYKNELGAAEDVINSLLDKVPGYEKVNELHGAVKDPISSFIKNMPAEEMNIASRPNDPTIDTNTFLAARTAIEKSSLPYGQGTKQFSQLRLLKEELKKLQTADPVALEKMGITNIDDYFKKIQGQSDIQAISRGIEKAGERNKNLLDSFSPDLNTVYKVSNIAGKTTSDMGKYLYKMPVESLGSVSGVLKTNPTTAFLGNALEQALQSPNATWRNAILFSIMQRPEARNVIKGSIPGMEEEGDVK